MVRIGKKNYMTFPILDFLLKGKYYYLTSKSITHSLEILNSLPKKKSKLSMRCQWSLGVYTYFIK